MKNNVISMIMACMFNSEADLLNEGSFAWAHYILEDDEAIWCMQKAIEYYEPSDREDRYVEYQTLLDGADFVVNIVDHGWELSPVDPWDEVGCLDDSYYVENPEWRINGIAPGYNHGWDEEELEFQQWVEETSNKYDRWDRMAKWAKAQPDDEYEEFLEFCANWEAENKKKEKIKEIVDDLRTGKYDEISSFTKLNKAVLSVIGCDVFRGCNYRGLKDYYWYTIWFRDALTYYVVCEDKDAAVLFNGLCAARLEGAANLFLYFKEGGKLYLHNDDVSKSRMRDNVYKFAMKDIANQLEEKYLR